MGSGMSGRLANNLVNPKSTPPAAMSFNDSRKTCWFSPGGAFVSGPMPPRFPVDALLVEEEALFDVLAPLTREALLLHPSTTLNPNAATAGVAQTLASNRTGNMSFVIA